MLFSPLWTPSSSIAAFERFSVGGCSHDWWSAYRFGHITDYMRDVLHWLPVQQRIHYRLSSIVWHCVLGNASSYLLELFILTSACSGRRSLRSASKRDFMVPRTRTATRQKRVFSIVGPSVWNGLPSDLRSLPRDLSSSFYKLLKTLFFGRAWAGSASE